MIEEDGRRDAEYRVEVARDKMAATLTVIPAKDGGEEAAMQGIDAALGRAGVVFGIDRAALEQALAMPGTAVTVARGAVPLPSVDARLEVLIDVSQTRHLKEDSHGRTDFRELGILRAVEPGTPLMRRHPPKLGTPGHTVLGAEVPVLKAKDAKFPVRLPGVQASPEDPDLLVAAIAGQPIVHRDGVSVDPVLALGGVGLSTGNIDFPGTVEIKGDVQAGMRIRAGGDVIIHGTLESAEVESGGEVQVKGGVIGQHTGGREGETKANSVRIRAKSNVRAHHVDNAWIFSEQSVFVDESIVQSEVVAMDEVVVGKQGARKGHIIGGSTRATRAVTAYCLGSPGSSNTRITVGLNPELANAIDEKKALVAAKLKEHDDLEKVIKVLEARTAGREEMLAKARLTFEKTGEELRDLIADQAALEGQLKLADNAEVAVKAKVHPGTTITIGRRFTVVTDTLGAGSFRLVTRETAGREEEVVDFSGARTR
ncbi:MAG: DUF342 domain-containing protein [Ignavibacteria bacterium]